MNQTSIGGYIARKRKEQNLTQEQLAEQLGVSNKTISKWENGKRMPDYSIIQKLCDALHVTLPELMDGEDAAEDSVRVYDEARELSEFRRACPNSWYCESCAMHRENNGTCGNESLQIKHAPQSWCYVEEG